MGILCYYHGQASLLTQDVKSQRRSGVTVLTVDAAEGLEFDAFILRVSNKRLNLYVADWRRALVALTGSRGPLSISCPQEWLQNVPAGIAVASTVSFDSSERFERPDKELAPYFVRHFELQRRAAWIGPFSADGGGLYSLLSQQARVTLKRNSK